MYNYYYSAKNNVFIAADSALLQDDNYQDAVKVSDSIFTAYFQYEKEGQRRAGGADGLPCWLDIPAPTQEQLNSVALNKKEQILAEVNHYINNQQWSSKLALGRLNNEEVAAFSRWLDYLDAVAAVDITTAPEINWPEPPATQAM